MPQHLANPKQAMQYFSDKMQFTTGPAELKQMIKAGKNITIIDVRAEKDYQEGHIPGAINLPFDKWDTFKGLQKDRNNVVYCYSQQCHLAAQAALKFAEQDYPVIEMEGGFNTWKAYDFDIEK